MPQERSREECEHIIASATDGWEEYMNFDICTEFEVSSVLLNCVGQCCKHGADF